MEELKNLVEQIQEEILRDKYILEYCESNCSIYLKDENGNRAKFDWDYTSAIT